jgi:glycerate 2-kinase
MKDFQKKIEDIFLKTLKRTSPRSAIHNTLAIDTANNRLLCQNHPIPLQNRNLYVIGSGKAACEMASATETILENHLTAGMIVHPDSITCSLAKIQAIPARHPEPDRSSVEATSALLKFCQSIPECSLVLNLLSGGTSSLLCLPAGNLTLKDLQTTHSLLLKSGADIHEINTVRKALSAVKGGQMLKYLRHTELIDLIISDVPDDSPADIGSGPTTAQTISFRKAAEILKRYELSDTVPEKVIKHLFKAPNRPFDTQITTDEIPGHRQIIISSAKMAAHTASRLWEHSEKIPAVVDQTPWKGPVHELADHIMKSASARSASDPVLLIFYGESYVNVTGSGRGGRNQELALHMTTRLPELNRNALFLSAGTDGVDGPTDAAGAFADHNTLDKARADGLNPESFLKENDSYNFFKQAGGQLITGPTGNNLMDLQFLLLL